MSYDVIKLDYGLANDMAKIFREGGNQLRETLKEMSTVAATLEEGALQGVGGAAFVEAIKTNLTTSLDKLAQKFDEMDGDIQKAIQYMKEADERSKGFMSSV